MKIEMFIGAVILSILVIDAIRYRIIYFKFKKFNICDYKEIMEHLNGMQKVSIPIKVGKDGSPEEEDPAALEEKMKTLVEVMNKVSSFDTNALKSLDKDLGYLLFHYTQIGECLTDMITFGAEEVEESAYNDLGGNDGSKEERDKSSK